MQSTGNTGNVHSPMRALSQPKWFSGKAWDIMKRVCVVEELSRNFQKYRNVFYWLLSNTHKSSWSLPEWLCTWLLTWITQKKNIASHIISARKISSRAMPQVASIRPGTDVSDCPYYSQHKSVWGSRWETLVFQNAFKNIPNFPLTTVTVAWYH